MNIDTPSPSSHQEPTAAAGGPAANASSDDDVDVQQHEQEGVVGFFSKDHSTDVRRSSEYQTTIKPSDVKASFDSTLKPGTSSNAASSASPADAPSFIDTSSENMPFLAAARPKDPPLFSLAPFKPNSDATNPKVTSNHGPPMGKHAPLPANAPSPEEQAPESPETPPEQSPTQVIGSHESPTTKHVMEYAIRDFTEGEEELQHRKRQVELETDFDLLADPLPALSSPSDASSLDTPSPPAFDGENIPSDPEEANAFLDLLVNHVVPSDEVRPVDHDEPSFIAPLVDGQMDDVDDGELELLYTQLGMTDGTCVPDQLQNFLDNDMSAMVAMETDDDP